MSDSSTPETSPEAAPNTVHLKAELPYAGPRALATATRGRIREIIDSGEVAKVDLDGVAVMTPAFADQCFGELFSALGEAEFRKSVEVSGASEACRALLEAVVCRRAGPGSEPVDPVDQIEQIEEEPDAAETSGEAVAGGSGAAEAGAGDKAIDARSGVIDAGEDAAAEAAYLEDDDDDDFTEIE